MTNFFMISKTIRFYTCSYRLYDGAVLHATFFPGQTISPRLPSLVTVLIMRLQIVPTSPHDGDTFSHSHHGCHYAPAVLSHSF